MVTNASFAEFKVVSFSVDGVVTNVYGPHNASEMLHSVRTKKIPGMMVKLDIAKSHDKIIWQFMRKMITTFGFQDD